MDGMSQKYNLRVSTAGRGYCSRRLGTTGARAIVSSAQLNGTVTKEAAKRIGSAALSMVCGGQGRGEGMARNEWELKVRTRIGRGGNNISHSPKIILRSIKKYMRGQKAAKRVE